MKLFQSNLSRDFNPLKLQSKLDILLTIFKQSVPVDFRDICSTLQEMNKEQRSFIEKFYNTVRIVLNSGATFATPECVFSTFATPECVFSESGSSAFSIRNFYLQFLFANFVQCNILFYIYKKSRNLDLPACFVLHTEQDLFFYFVLNTDENFVFKVSLFDYHSDVNHKGCIVRDER